MNLDNAVAAHTQWKTKFRAAITNKSILDADSIGKDNCCELGLWLNSDGRKTCGTKPEFVALIEKHKLFHKEAGKLATLINMKKYTDADAALGNGTSFNAASTDTTIAIGRLKKVCNL